MFFTVIIAGGAYVYVVYQIPSDIQVEKARDEYKQGVIDKQNQLDSMTFEDCKKVDHNSSKEFQNRCMNMNGIYDDEPSGILEYYDLDPNSFTIIIEQVQTF